MSHFIKILYLEIAIRRIYLKYFLLKNLAFYAENYSLMIIAHILFMQILFSKSALTALIGKGNHFLISKTFSALNLYFDKKIERDNFGLIFPHGFCI